MIKQQNWLKCISFCIILLFLVKIQATTYFYKVEFILKTCLFKDFSICNDKEIEAKYIESITAQGFTKLYTSNWLNTIIFYSDSFYFPLSPFISKISLLDSTSNTQILSLKQEPVNTEIIETTSNNKSQVFQPYQFLNLNQLHAKGFKGDNIKIMVLDGGFNNVNRLITFKTGKNPNQFLGLFDISINNKHAYLAGQHGTQVLASIVANSPGLYTGTAPNASFAIATTETEAIESPVEEWAFIQMVEYATKAKYQILHASLGYTTFDNKNLNYTYAQYTDSTLPILKVMKLAYDRGLLIVNSAGNSGASKWKYVSFPAISPYIITVGATQNNKKFADFSSNGYANKLLKPNVASWGLNASLINSLGQVSYASGTSFAAPQIAGGLACVMQVIPNKPVSFYFNLLHCISNQSFTPDTLMGYGIPNFDAALLYNKKSKFPFFTSSSWQDTMQSIHEIKTFSKINKKYTLTINDDLGNIRYKSTFVKNLSLISGTQIGSLPKGTYTIKIKRGFKKWKKTIYYTQ